MKTIRGLCLTLAGLMLLTSQAFAADYNFETPAPSDYYGSTSYEEVYGAQYNYGGINAVDFLDPLAENAVSTTTGATLQYGINASSGSIYPDTSVSSIYPVQWGDTNISAVTQFTSVSDVERSDGSIGTLVIPSLGIRYKAYDGPILPPCEKVSGISLPQVPGTEISVFAVTIAGPTIISVLSKTWTSVIRSVMKRAWALGPMPSVLWRSSTGLIGVI